MVISFRENPTSVIEFKEKSVPIRAMASAPDLRIFMSRSASPP